MPRRDDAAHNECASSGRVRGEDRSDSDVDMLVDFEPGSSLFDVLHLTAELESLLGRHVDVVSAGGLKPRDKHILDDAIDL